MRLKIDTERLHLRNLTPEDAAAVFCWVGDPAVTRYVDYPLYHHVEDVRSWLLTRHQDDPDNFYLGISLKESGGLIGAGGLVYRKENDVWMIGYNLRADQWGNSYVVEAISGNRQQAH